MTDLSDTKHGGFAFPQSNPDVAYSDYIGGGMTLRDWFAGQALAGLASSSHPDRAATLAYQCADAMLKAREVKP